MAMAQHYKLAACVTLLACAVCAAEDSFTLCSICKRALSHKMAYVIPNEMPVPEVLSTVFGKWKPEVHKAAIEAITAYSTNLQTAEDLRFLMIASPRKSSDSKPTLWIPFCQAIQESVGVFDNIAQHSLKIKLMDKGSLNTATPEVGTAQDTSDDTAETTATRVNVSLQDLCKIFQGAADAVCVFVHVFFVRVCDPTHSCLSSQLVDILAASECVCTALARAKPLHPGL